MSRKVRKNWEPFFGGACGGERVRVGVTVDLCWGDVPSRQPAGRWLVVERAESHEHAPLVLGPALAMERRPRPVWV